MLPEAMQRASAPVAGDTLAEKVEKEEGTPEAGRFIRAPQLLCSVFKPGDVQVWDPSRFEMLDKIQDAVQNHGQVLCMRDAGDGKCVAVKQMPNDWVCMSHEDFLKLHPLATEQPWQGIGCTSFLSSVGYSYGVTLRGVFRDGESTRVVMDLASDGDLFSWCNSEAVPMPGPEREALVLPLALQIGKGVMQLHDMGIVHGDLSLENIILSKENGEAALSARIIDFGMTTTQRMLCKSVRGKSSYQAPEMHSSSEYDGFLSDAFAVGVTLFALFLKDYPWLSTRPGGCKCFEFVRQHGVRAFLHQRKSREGGGKLAECISEPVLQLLEGLLEFDPARRLTLGESAWSSADGRKSIWDEAYFRPASCNS